MNPYSDIEREEAMMSACYVAVQEHFCHLALRDIINPPHQFFDAALARQCVIHMLAHHFAIPRRRITTCMERQRTSTSFAIRRIDARCECDVFAAAYDRIAARAKQIFLTQLETAMNEADAA